MKQATLDVAARWERALGDPASPNARMGFHAALEFDEQERFPRPHLDTLRELGCFEWLIPAGEGGALREPEQLILLGRLVSRRDLATGIAFGQTLLGSLPVWLAGSPAQRARLAAELRAGRLGCLALTEKAHGSDILANELTARAQPGGGWRLDGAKWLINNAREGSFATVLGRTAHAGRAAELSLWWLHRPAAPTPQWRAHPKIRTHGVRAADISGFELRGFTVDDEARLQGGEPAPYTVLKTLQVSRILCGGFSLGAVDTMFRLAFDFARERRLYGKRALDIPVVRARLAACHARILAADLVAQAASRAIAALPQELSLLSAVAKYHVPTEVEAVGRELGIVLGARHYVRSEFPWGVFQKALRDAEVVSLFDGSTQVNLGLIAAQLRALGEGLAQAQREQPRGDVLERLLRVDAHCEGWPAQGELRLSNGGRDSVLAAFLALGEAVPARGGPCAAAVAALRAQCLAWLRDCHEATVARRLAHDSVRVMALAQRYALLHCGAALVLGWHFNREAAGRGSHRLDDDVLLCALASHFPAAGLEVPDECSARLVEAAAGLLDGHRLLSLQDFELAPAA